jgi:hypothetical protein
LFVYSTQLVSLKNNASRMNYVYQTSPPECMAKKTLFISFIM